MAKALVVYTTRTGETQKIGELIAEGIRISGHEATLASDKEIKKTSDLEGMMPMSSDRQPTTAI
jgi:flavodoxin